MNDEIAKITREYLEMSIKLGEDRAFEWLTALYPEYVDQVQDYLDEFLDVAHKYSHFN